MTKKRTPKDAAIIVRHTFSDEDLEKVAQSAVKKTLFALGVDISDNKGIEEWRGVFAGAKAWHNAVQKGAKMTYMTMITVLVTGTMGLLWMGIRAKLGLH